MNNTIAPNAQTEIQVSPQVVSSAAGLLDCAEVFLSRADIDGRFSLIDRNQYISGQYPA
jgi:hypothetical protein